MPYNFALHNRLPVIGQEDSEIRCYLLNMDDENQRWEFLVLPTSISYTASNDFSNSYALFGTDPNTRYRGSQVGSLRISDIVLSTPSHQRSLRPLMKSLEALRFPQVFDPTFGTPPLVPTETVEPPFQPPIEPPIQPPITEPPITLPIDTTSKYLYPPRLSLVWGSRVIQPLYLTDISFDEVEHLNGEPTTINLSIAFTGCSQIQF